MIHAPSAAARNLAAVERWSSNLRLADEPTFLERKFHANHVFRDVARRLLAVHNKQKQGSFAGWPTLEKQKGLFHPCECSTPCPLAHCYRVSLGDGILEHVLLDDRCTLRRAPHA